MTAEVIRNGWALAANLMVAAHFLYVMFVVIGELLIITGKFAGWRWVRNAAFRITHLIATVIVAAQALLKVPCPLTVLENIFREKAGQTAEWNISFIGRLLRSIIFYDLPDWFFMLLYVGFGAVVVITLLLVPFNLKKR